jgi:hypothetical protein
MNIYLVICNDICESSDNRSLTECNDKKLIIFYAFIPVHFLS